MAKGTFLYPAITDKLGVDKIEQLEQEYASLLEQLKKSNDVVELALSSGTQSTTTIGGNITVYNTQITMDNSALAGKDLTKLISAIVYHPNGSLQLNRMFITSVSVQQYTSPTQAGIVVSCTPVQTYNDGYYKGLRVRLIFNSANYGA